MIKDIVQQVGPVNLNPESNVQSGVGVVFFFVFGVVLVWLFCCLCGVLFWCVFVLRLVFGVSLGAYFDSRAEFCGFVWGCGDGFFVVCGLEELLCLVFWVCLVIILKVSACFLFFYVRVWLVWFGFVFYGGVFVLVSFGRVGVLLCAFFDRYSDIVVRRNGLVKLAGITMNRVDRP